MVKKTFHLIALGLLLIIITSCTSSIIPKGYYDTTTYTNANSGQLNNTLQLSIYNYEKKPNFANNKFMCKLDEEKRNLLEVLLSDFKDAVNASSFSDAFDFSISDIKSDDLAYIDYSDNQTNKYFAIYYYSNAKNTLYYCYLKY